MSEKPQEVQIQMDEQYFAQQLGVVHWQLMKINAENAALKQKIQELLAKSNGDAKKEKKAN